MKHFSLLVSCFGFFVSITHAQIAPVISSISPSHAVNQGQPLTLSVSVNGTQPFTFQWVKESVALPGAIASSFSIGSAAISDAGTYRVTISNAGGSTTSGIILIDVVSATPPSIYSQPGNVVRTAGEDLSLFASVSGSEPLTYTWAKNGQIVATTSSYAYVKPNAQIADSGTYSYTVSNIAGSVTSTPFAVAVTESLPPVITVQPRGTTFYPGSSTWLEVSLANGSGVTYQWYNGDVPIPNANWYYYTTSVSGTFRVHVTNSAGTTISTPAQVTLVPAGTPAGVSLTSGPINATLGLPLSLYAYVGAGSYPLTYQWKRNGIVIPGATSQQYYRESATLDDHGSYEVVVSNAIGSATSNPTLVTIVSPQRPLIVSHPRSITTYPGGWAQLGVEASGTGSLLYQWRKNGVNIAGATHANYYGPEAGFASSDSGEYAVVVSNNYGSTTSNTATVLVAGAQEPTIIRHPASTTVVEGRSLSLGSDAIGHPTPTYQWRKDGVNIPGATSRDYNVGPVTNSHSGDYTVVVSNSAGTVISSAAEVTVLVSSPTVITSHPSSASLLVGSSYQMHVDFFDAHSSGYTIKWYRNNAEREGYTWSNYYIGNAQPSDAGTYKAVVTNSAGDATTYESIVTVDLSSARPVITFVSGSRALAGGSSTTLWIELAPGVGPYTVNWKKDGVIVPNAHSLNLNLPQFTVSMVGTYTAEVTTSQSTYVSRPIIVELIKNGVAPTILSHPGDLTQSVGTTALFSVQADGQAPLSYQWKKDGISIPGAVSSYYQVNYLVAQHEGDYTAAVSNLHGTVVSKAASLTVFNPAAVAPIFSYNPASQTLTNSNSTFYLNVDLLNRVGNETFQWYKDGAPISGATSAYFQWSHSGLSAAAAGVYKVVATNAAGSSTSAEATVAFVTPATVPVFTLQPSNRKGAIGSFVTFTTSATGGSNLIYQWRKNGVSISGATGASLTLTNLQPSDVANYSVYAINEVGNALSSVVELTLGPEVRTNDFNGDGRSDLIWQHRGTGERTIWLMDNGVFTSSIDLGTVSVEWNIACVADFDGNGSVDLVWQNTITGQRYIWLMTGTAQSGGVDLGHVPIEWVIAGAADFSGDGRPDLVWQNTATGQAYLWEMNGTVQLSSVNLGAGSPEISLAGAGDFSGDGRPDLVWQNTATGRRFLWIMNGSLKSSEVDLVTLPAEWALAGTGDYNHDGKLDLAWQNTVTGQRELWIMNGTVKAAVIELGSVPIVWQLGTGIVPEFTNASPVPDFNADGKNDLVLQNHSTGERKIWLMNGTTLQTSVGLGVIPAEWKIVGSGDFDGNGSPDLVWQNTLTGQRYVWLMTGTTYTSGVSLGHVAAEWDIAAARDFNQDGKPDLLWQNTVTGQRYIWLMDGALNIGGANLGEVAVEWNIAGAGDFNSDGQPDIVWENSATGQRYLWFMNGTVQSSGADLGIVALAWKIAGTGDFNNDGNADLVWQNSTTGQRVIWFMNGSVNTGTADLPAAAVEWDAVL